MFPGTVNGKVSKSDNTGLSNAIIETIQNNTVVGSVVSDTGGNYTITVSSGVYELRVSRTGYITKVTTNVVVVSNVTRTVNVSLLSEFGWVIGYVKRRDGVTAIASAVIELWSSGVIKSSTTSNTNGYYELSIATPGIYTVQCGITGYEIRVTTGVVVSLDRTETVNFTLNYLPNVPANPSPADGSINHKINLTLSWTGGDGDPGEMVTYEVYFTSDVRASLYPPNKLGNYVNTTQVPQYPVPNLMYSTTYYWQIISSDELLAKTTGPVWSFVTKPAVGIITGKVTKRDGLTGLTGCVVELSNVQSPKSISSTTTDINGNYTLLLSSGTYDVKVQIPNYKSQTAAGVVVTVDETVTVDFSLSREPEQVTGKDNVVVAGNVFNPKRGQSARVMVNLTVPGKIVVKVYNLSGTLVREFTEIAGTVGNNELYWDGKNNSGEPVGSDIYFVTVKTELFQKTERVIVNK